MGAGAIGLGKPGMGVPIPGNFGGGTSGAFDLSARGGSSDCDGRAGTVVGGIRVLFCANAEPTHALKQSKVVRISRQDNGLFISPLTSISTPQSHCTKPIHTAFRELPKVEVAGRASVLCQSR
jgi:hypothetical protein